MIVQFTYQVPKTAELEDLVQRSSQKLERVLLFFAPELVQLHGRLTRNSSREGVHCSLNLRLPTGQFASDTHAATAQAALRAARTDLLEQIKKHKEKLRLESRPRRPSRELPAEAAPAPQPTHMPAPDLSRYIGAHLPELRRFIERQIHWRETIGALRPGEMDAREVLDEAIALGLSDPDRRAETERGRWFQLLASEAIRQLARQNQAGESEEAVALDAVSEADDEADDNDEFDAAAAPSSPHGQPDPWLDASNPNPETLAANDEMLRQLAQRIADWPAEEKEDLWLFLLDGFTPGELARLSRRPPERIRQNLSQARQRLELDPNLPQDLRRQVLSQLPGQRGAA